VLAAIDARRGEVFAAAWHGERSLLAPAALAPARLAQLDGLDPAGLLAVGDGAVRFREVLEGAGASVPADDSPAHRLCAVAICRLGAAGEPVDREGLLPDYLREPDAVPSRP
jgi:tRNA threonylcarbamoyladenosine biosynthesis protein TsaB